MWMNTEIVALNTSQQTYYSPWFAKGADNAVFTMDMILNTVPGGAGAFTVTVWTKNREDEGSAPGSTVGTLASLTGATPGFFEVTCTGLKELVRFQIVFRAGAVGQGAIFRMLAPTWFSTAVQSSEGPVRFRLAYRVKLLVSDSGASNASFSSGGSLA